MNRIILILSLMALLFYDSSTCTEKLTVMDDEFELLTQQEVIEGVQLDKKSMFAYSILDDGTVKLIRYTWFHHEVYIPEQVNGARVSGIGADCFIDSAVTDIFLSKADIDIDDGAFDYIKGTVWVPADHASLSVGTVLIQKTTGIVVYESDYDNETRVQFRTCIEIEDY